jgi:hypothetical protein
MLSTPLLLFSRYTARCEAHEVLGSIRDLLEAAPSRLGIALAYRIEAPSWGVHPDRPLHGAVTKDHCARWRQAPVAQVMIRRSMAGGLPVGFSLDAYIYPDGAGKCVTVFCYRDVTAERFIVACDPDLAAQYGFTETQAEALLVSLQYRLLNPDEFSD